MKLKLIIAAFALILAGCGGSTTPKAVPGAAGGHLYDLMDEDSTEQKADTITADQ
ncbi:MAG TPA: hypothetical protein VEB40_08835 [Flavipsychrobacter sp.]|nr:hypothetical protein [Flavipsychrobacter sp.]